MQEEGIEATSVTFNSVLDVVSRQLSEPTMLQEVIDDMCKANVTPDVVTYSILMKASCSSGNVQGALSLFRQIQSNGLMFDQVGFNTLMLACSKADLVADAEEIFQEMLKAGMTPTPVTTSIMVKMYGKAKMLDKAVAISELLERDYGQKPNLYVYTCLIQACVQNKQVRRSWEIFNKMMQCHVEPDAVTYGTVIHGCVYLNKFQYAMSLVRRAYCKPRGQEDPDNPFSSAGPLKHSVPLQPDVMQMLLSALRRKEQVALMQELEEIMDEFKISREGRNHGGKHKRASCGDALV
jgi:pentatricopeptide repeat protein